MSRRRPAPRPPLPGWSTVTIKCAGSTATPHAIQRVATVTARPGVDETDVPFRVRVDYGGHGEPPSETGAFRPIGLAGHMTRRFVCKRCGDDLPVTDEKLAKVVVEHGESILYLRDLRAKVSK